MKGEYILRIIFIALLLFVTTFFPAGVKAWTKVDTIDGDEYYLDISSINIKERTAWLRVDLRRKADFNALKVSSTRGLVQFDCAQSKMRTLEQSYFAKRELKGFPLQTNSTPTDWRRIPPNTPMTKVIKLVCQ